MKCAIANGDTIPISHQPQIDKDGIDFFDGSGCSIDTIQMNQSRMWDHHYGPLGR
jgi:hypothetical protein